MASVEGILRHFLPLTRIISLFPCFRAFYGCFQHFGKEQVRFLDRGNYLVITSPVLLPVLPPGRLPSFPLLVVDSPTDFDSVFDEVDSACIREHEIGKVLIAGERLGERFRVEIA